MFKYDWFACVLLFDDLLVLLKLGYVLFKQGMAWSDELVRLKLSIVLIFLQIICTLNGGIGIPVHDLLV